MKKSFTVHRGRRRGREMEHREDGLGERLHPCLLPKHLLSKRWQFAVQSKPKQTTYKLSAGLKATN